MAHLTVLLSEPLDDRLELLNAHGQGLLQTVVLVSEQTHGTLRI